MYAFREEEIDKAVANFGKWKQALEAKVTKKEAELLEAKQKREELIEEIREQVGYTVDPRDERFQAILEQKEKEDKKRKKEEKKKKRAEKMLAYILQSNDKIEKAQDNKESNNKTEPQKNENNDDEKDSKKVE